MAKTGAVYLTIVDHGAPDRLLAVVTPIAGVAQLHETTMQNNVMRMRPVDGLAVTSTRPVTLAPGGTHVMLTGLKAPLRKGESFPLTLTFEHAGAIQTSVTVEGVGAAGPVPGGGAALGMDMSMPGMDMSAPMNPPKQP